MPFNLLPWFSSCKFHLLQLIYSCWFFYSHSVQPACISWSFLTRVVVQGEGVSLTPNHRLVDQAFIFMFPRDRVFQLEDTGCTF
jgi:hypothetical protein